MQIAFFSAKSYDRRFFDAANAAHHHTFLYFEPRLTSATASLAHGAECVCAFVNDQLDAGVLEALTANGTRLIALRSAGYNHVDRAAAARLGVNIVYVPHYSPHSVAEHTVALMLALNRKIHRAYNRVREGNFALDGLLGFDFHGRCAGLVGAGKIGLCVAQILTGLGCRVRIADPQPSASAISAGFEFCSLEELLATGDVVSLHCPLTPATRHLVNSTSIARMKRGMMLINTSRGGLVDTAAVIDALLDGRIGYFGLDVYEDESELFYEDRSNVPIQDDTFSRLLTFPNVLITGHQAFFTEDALTTIAETTLQSVTDFAAGRPGRFVL